MSRKGSNVTGDRLAVCIEDAAELVGLGRDTLYRLLLVTGEIPSFKVGGRRLVPVAGLREWVERQTGEATGNEETEIEPIEPDDAIPKEPLNG